ncbi:protein NRT1/ PTR FAMILY 2.7-like [Nicotiana tomentosiformis]|uniref:protein NRT1/ PTR FAMILY 2.7-like n=1 Tax=Nicotiana tomentosiformis TaxID=4098 RepID=UPI00051B69CB|nr:protein NRT1/ PTR FAMILY 2.7-like [Nicotiana tomentosiformis]
MNCSVNFVLVIAVVLADSFFGTFSGLNFFFHLSTVVFVWYLCFGFLIGVLVVALLLPFLSRGSTANNLSTFLEAVASANMLNDSDFCMNPTKSQFALLYGGITLALIGLGGMRTNIATIGANQFRDSKYQNMFFNWFFFTMYIGTVLGFTAIVDKEDNISWKVGFYVCIAANFLGLVVFLAGSRFYHYATFEVSPFTSLARVIVAAISKRKLPVSPSHENWYHGPYGSTAETIFLNRASLKYEGDVKPDGSIAKPWKLCTVSEVEDFKSLMRTLPLWSSSIFLSTPIALLISLSVLQALAMDRHIGPHFQIPAGSIPVIILISTAIFLTIFDRLLFPMWEKLTSQSVTPFKRIGAGHVLTFVGVGVGALVESKRLNVAHNSLNLSQGRSNIVPISVLWLVPQLVIIGIGEAFLFPGQVALYYQEFPTSLKSVSTAMTWLAIAIVYCWAFKFGLA